ncbi:unnamed protein product [Ranitomeya imitator]|uniref:Reverse transcriptase domain-containing protein n=1 Tax=Ranitomeya imitator TaxID=111125 RepID=A0ABN9MIJ5_9NEOB|nr:unnamed protein product [Ranitomeya imitator]
MKRRIVIQDSQGSCARPILRAGAQAVKEEEDRTTDLRGNQLRDLIKSVVAEALSEANSSSRAAASPALFRPEAPDLSMPPLNPFEEALTCELSPLGFHLSPSVKELIWNNQFVDLFSLLPSIVPKKEPGSFRMIHHLSYPVGQSLNDEVDKTMCSVTYSSFDGALDMLRKFGPNFLKHGNQGKHRVTKRGPALSYPMFTLVTGIVGRWRAVFILTTASFLTNAFLWVFPCPVFILRTFPVFCIGNLESSGCEAGILHYLDDFLFVGPSQSMSCENTLSRFLDLCAFFGVPIAHEKTVAPSCCIEFLGITIDSAKMETVLPEEKIDKLHSSLENLLAKDKITLKELQSLLGLLNFALRLV